MEKEKTNETKRTERYGHVYRPHNEEERARQQAHNIMLCALAGGAFASWALPPAQLSNRPHTGPCELCHAPWNEIDTRSLQWVSKDKLRRVVCYDCLFDATLFARSMLNVADVPDKKN